MCKIQFFRLRYIQQVILSFPREYLPLLLDFFLHHISFSTFSTYSFIINPVVQLKNLFFLHKYLIFLLMDRYRYERRLNLCRRVLKPDCHILLKSFTDMLVYFLKQALKYLGSLIPTSSATWYALLSVSLRSFIAYSILIFVRYLIKF